MTIVKIPDKRIDNTGLDSVCAAKINEIIDYLNSKDHMVEGDWIDQAFDRYYSNETEYAGPDWEAYDKKVFRLAIEEYMPKNTPPVTSTIEELAEELVGEIYIKGDDIVLDKTQEAFVKLLSSLSPIQKKRTKEETEKRYDAMLFRLKPSYKKKEIDSLMLGTVLMFLKDHNLLQE